MTYTMADPQIQDFLNRNAAAAAAVAAHENEFLAPGAYETWDQVALSQDDSLPVRVRGNAYTDPSYGSVIVYPDAAGVLHFSATDNAALVAAVNKPAYVSPSGNTFLDLLSEFEHNLTTGLETVAIVAVFLFLAFRSI